MKRDLGRMATKKKRNELRNNLTGKTESLQEVFDLPQPNKRTLKAKIADLEKAMMEYEAHYNKYVDEEDNADVKEEWKTEKKTLLRTADDLFYPAEDKLETIEAADQPASLPLDGEYAVLKFRADAAKDNMDRRAKFIKEGVKEMESPSKALIDTQLDVIAQFRTEASVTITAAYKPLIDLAVTKETALALEKQSNDFLTQISIGLDKMERTTMNHIKDNSTIPASPAATPVSESAPSSKYTAYKTYTKPEMPKFTGKFRDYPKWKEEFKECILPHFDPKKQVRLLDDHSPKECDLRNCSTVEEAWQKLDDKYANPHLISSNIFQSTGKVNFPNKKKS